MHESPIAFQKNFTYLKPKYFWGSIAVWNLSGIFVWILLNYPNALIKTTGLAIAFIVLCTLATLSFKVSTDKMLQTRVVKTEKICVFNPNVFFLIGCILSVFACVTLVGAAVIALV